MFIDSVLLLPSTLVYAHKLSFHMFLRMRSSPSGPWSLFIIFHFVALASCSFMAIGPPGAPDASYMDSALDVIREFERLNSTEVASKWINYGTDFQKNGSIFNSSSKNRTSQLESAYYWLADEKLLHKVRF
jgi:hypothetical protein